MKKIATTFALLALCTTSAFASNPVRISQVYGGGGSSTGYYTKDYVELFNASGSPVVIGGWSIQYGSATGTAFASSAPIVILPVGATIEPCGYYLIALGAIGTGGLALPVTPDLDVTPGGPSLSATTGKIALINVTTSPNNCSGNVTGPIYVDVVGFGTGNCFETADAPGPSNQSADVRNVGGMIDTDNNSADFTVVTNPVPRNSSSPKNMTCLQTPVTLGSWGKVKALYR